MKFLKTLIFFFITISAFSQVIVKEEIIMTGVDSVDRRVMGISFPEDSSNAANAGSMSNGQLIFGEASGVNLLLINLNPAITQYILGMVINFKTSASNTGAVTIQLNGLAPVALMKNGAVQLDSMDLISNQMVTAIYDGNYFQVISKLNRKCPNGFADVNKDYCIELTERDSLNWFNATKICGDLNSRLCTQAEWAFACENSAMLNLINMIDNMEWIDSAANSSNQSKTMGVNGVGVAGCNSGHTQVFTENRSFRCCYSK